MNKNAATTLERVVEVVSLVEKQQALHAMAAHVPSSHNYHDLLMAEGDDGLSRYRVFAALDAIGRQAGLGVISPEGNFNVYTPNSEAAAALVPVLHRTQSLPPPWVRGDECALQPLRAQEELSEALSRATAVAALATPVSTAVAVGSKHWSLAPATSAPSDRAFVADWITSFNGETNASFPIPSNEDLASGRYLILRTSDADASPVAAYVNTVRSPSRHWIGRFWTPPTLRRQGFGRVLLSLAASLAREKGQSELALHVRADDELAMAFYANFGFREVGRCFYARIR